MSATIERITLQDAKSADKLQRESIRLHQKRYRFACRWARNARVLDIACGCGYGSAMLKKAGAREVVGIDIAPEAVAEARELYAKPGITFAQADYRELKNPSKRKDLAPLFDEPFDLIVSLETIEHLPDPDDFADTVLRHLKRGGVFTGSVPVTPSMDANPYHLQDFSPMGFRRFLKRHGLKPMRMIRQRQPYNPLTVRSQMVSNDRTDIRRSLGKYYVQHPSKFFLRIYATFRFGFVNLYDVIASKKL